MEDRDTPLIDWLSELFDPSKERRKARRARLRAEWGDVKHFLMGLHGRMIEELEAEGEDVDEAVDHIVSAYIEIVVERMIQEADTRLDWRRVKHAELREWLEENDGKFIRRLIMVARATAALKRTNPRGSRLFGLLAGPVHVATPAPEVIEVEGDEDDTPTRIVRPGDAAADRLKSLTIEDRRKTRHPANLPDRPVGLMEVE